MARRRIQLLGEAFPGRGSFDVAASRALLLRASRGLEPETLRLYRTHAMLAFGPKDLLEPGFPAARKAARERGFEPVRRLAGGRAAVFHEETLAFAWAIPDPTPRERVRQRYAELAEIMVEAFRGLGVDARIGEAPGEYCPGEFSVNARGMRKLMGVGQRVVTGAAHVGGVVAVAGAERIRAVLVPVYRALGLDWRPESAGSLADEVGALELEGVERAIRSAFRSRHDLEEGKLGPELLGEAARLEPEHRLD